MRSCGCLASDGLKLMTITYVNLSWRGTAHGIGNAHPPNSGVVDSAVDREQIDQIRPFHTLARRLK